MHTIHECQQGSAEWLDLRTKYFTASEAPAMMGESKYQTRNTLLHLKATGVATEVDAATQRLFDAGHETEAKARAILEGYLGEDLFPIVATRDNLLASVDGIDMAETTVFEHKLLNKDVVAMTEAGELSPHYYWQLEQQLYVTGAERALFICSDGTEENLYMLEYRPVPGRIEKLLAGWAQFERDLAAYVPSESSLAVVAEAVQDLPAVSVQVNGQIEVRENFKIFEVALRDFLENKLIREPETDQDFADLDLQIKAMKKAEDTLNAAEAMMLAQIQSVDEAKRQKDMLAKLVRDNRLMAEKLLASEKERRRAEKVVAARKVFTDHVADLQREISGVRLDIAVPDFAGAIKGLKTMSSIQDKIDTALANGKIAADLQQLTAKPFDDFKLAVTARIDAHKKAEEARLEAERERIRREEATRLEAEQQQEQPLARETESVETTAPQLLAAAVRNIPRSTPNAVPSLRLGQINDRLAPIALTADGLARLGITHAATDKSAKLYHESDFSRICATLLRHIESVQAANN
ncbi:MULTISPECIES: lambda-exonuclease family protein [unclassified Brenneria]|uniref:lambda-exonuclease family protein n=1 Tax=unclassified Brenneria TaxID=2634434 RepID=UPI001557479B|nr:YqaJ viral recombinase family protein [Brenneria sp. hezel4-2-4]MEE3649500.1 YqaJ viral recombinase family protein [Brenneria sp. HEZEL_4_2_4]NPC99457.1 Heme peroxidase [Brenneria sp. hezel4-2-4]